MNQRTNQPQCTLIRLAEINCKLLEHWRKLTHVLFGRTGEGFTQGLARRSQE